MGVKVREKIKGSEEFWVFINHKGKRKALRVGDYGSAEEIAAKIRARLLLGEPIRKEEPTLPTLKEQYKRFRLHYMKATLKPSTYSSYEMSFRVHILPALGNLRLDEITRERLQAFTVNLVKTKVRSTQEPREDEPERLTLSKETIKTILKPLGVLLNDAVDKNLIPSSPVRGLSRYYRQAPVRHEDINPLSEDESIAFLNKAAEECPEHYGLFLMALHTGMRSGELAGLKWTDIDWRGGFTWVRRQIHKGLLQTLKTKNGLRKVDLSDAVLEALRALRKRKQVEYLRKGENVIPEWLFANQDGNYPDMTNLKARWFKRILRKAGISDRRFHDLRHSYASTLLSLGEPVTYVSRQMGHANPAITLRIYAHWVPGDTKRKAVNQLPSPQPIRNQEGIGAEAGNAASL